MIQLGNIRVDMWDDVRRRVRSRGWACVTDSASIHVRDRVCDLVRDPVWDCVESVYWRLR